MDRMAILNSHTFNEEQVFSYLLTIHMVPLLRSFLLGEDDEDKRAEQLP